MATVVVNISAAMYVTHVYIYIYTELGTNNTKY